MNAHSIMYCVEYTRFTLVLFCSVDMVQTEEAENERMHLMIALELKNPGTLFKAIVFLGQGK